MWCVKGQRSSHVLLPANTELSYLCLGTGGRWGELWAPVVAVGRTGCPSGAGSCVRSPYFSSRRSRCGFCGYVEAGGGSSYKEPTLPLQPLPTLPIPSLFEKKNPSLNTEERTGEGRKGGDGGGGEEGMVAKK